MRFFLPFLVVIATLFSPVFGAVQAPGKYTGEKISEDYATYTMTIGATTTAPTKATTPASDVAYYVVHGKTLFLWYTYAHAASTGAADGSGSYLFPLPTGYTMDTSKVGTLFTLSRAHVGTGSLGGDVQGVDIPKVYAYNSTNLWIQSHANGTVGSTNYSMTQAGLNISFFAIIPLL